MNLLIHIGYQKTGSTFLQRVVFKNHPNVLLLNRKEIRKVFLDVGSLHFDRAIAAAWFAKATSQRGPQQDWIVISEEELSGNILSGGNGGFLAKEVADRFAAVLPDARIGLFIRNQFDLIESTYRQYVKRGGSLGIRRFLFNNGCRYRFPLFDFEHFDYTKLIQYYLSLFGRERLFVFLQEDMKSDTPAFMRRFYSRLGMPYHQVETSDTHRSANDRMTRYSLPLARIANRFYDQFPINRRVVLHIPFLYRVMRTVGRWIDHPEFIKKRDRKSSLLGKDLRRLIGERYGASNTELAEILGVDLGAFGYPVLGSANQGLLDRGERAF